MKLRLPLTSNGLRVLAVTLVGTTVLAELEESAKGAPEFVDSSRVVPGVAASNGFAGGAKAGGYSAMPATIRKLEMRPFRAAATEATYGRVSALRDKLSLTSSRRVVASNEHGSSVAGRNVCCGRNRRRCDK